MRKTTITISFVYLLLFITSCIPAQTAEPTQSEQLLPTEPAEAIPEESAAENLLELPTPSSYSIRLALTDKPCSLSWSNSGEYLPCPGSLDEITDGHISLVSEPVINGGIQVNQPALLTIPAQLDSPFGGLFGRTPPYTVNSGDRFKAVLACETGYDGCDVTISLEYYNTDRRTLEVPGGRWQVAYDPEGGYVYADVSLEPLVGRTIQFSLTVRDNGSPVDDYALWIDPRIVNETSSAPAAQEELTINETEIVSGRVDMSTAPPYLYDDHPPGSPVAVVLFNAGAPQIFWTDTTETHPSFEIEAVAGSYYVFAYAPGIAGTDYATAAYTGLDPSCGQPMQYIVVEPGKPVTDLLINDWNWACNGTAERFDKPEQVIIP